MTRAALLRSWLVTPPLRGFWVVAWTAVALPVAALLDWTMDCPDVLGACCTPFFMFILFTAFLFGWRAGIISILASIATSCWIDLMQPLHMHMEARDSDIWGPGIFIFIGAALIVSVELIRRTIVHFSRLGSPNEYSSGIIFSLEQGQAWASWPGQPVPVRLGPQQEVESMMEDFIAQSKVARRLVRPAELGRSAVTQ